MYGNANFDALKLQIFDMSDATKISFTQEDIKEVAAYDRAAAKINPRIKSALVSTNSAAQKLSEIYRKEIADIPWEGKTFHSISEALAWGLIPSAYC
jgi:hypothetical protein